MPPQQPSSMSQKAAAAAFWGFKAFLTMGAFPVGGCVDVLVALGTQLLAEGVSVLARRTHRALGASASNNNNNNNNNNQADAAPNHDMYAGALESMVYEYGSVERFQREVKNFAQFSGELSRRLTLHGDAAGSATMATAARVYLQFVECDRDGCGYVSIEEFVVFCGKMEVSEESAMAKFFRADVNGDGKISFEEWTAMMMGRVGRGEVGVNCGGNHGLTRYTVRIHGVSCNFCGNLIPAGSLASGCRTVVISSRCAAAAVGSSARRTFSLPSAGAANGLNCRCSRGLMPFTARAGLYCTRCPALIPTGSPASGCDACHTDSCMDCVAIYLEARCASALNCRGRHGLTKTQITSLGYACDFCRTNLARGTAIFGCRTCQVASCVTCMWKDHRRALSSPPGALSCPGNHQLRTMHIYGYQQLGHTCKWCLSSPSLKDNVLRCHVCDVNVCGACRAGGVAQRARPPPAPASTLLLPLPPSYGENITRHSHHTGAPAPLPRGPPACAGGAQAPNFPRFPEQRQPAVVASACCPFPLDSVVKVLSLDDDDSKLMTVIGFEPSGGCCPGGDGGGEVVLNCWGKVVRAPSFLVSKLDGVK